jgi:murein DD-endopeptidase MepM/ murein hydrolase activator NlpD
MAEQLGASLVRLIAIQRISPHLDSRPAELTGTGRFVANNNGCGVVLKNGAVGDHLDRLRSWFPDREFFMRSQGQVRFIKLSSKLQMRVAGAVALVLFIWLAAMAAVATSSFIAARDRLSLLNREAAVASSESRVSTYRKSLDSVASDLARRQDVIEKMVQTNVGDLPADERAGETVSNSDTEAASTINKVSAAVPEAAGLAHIEARQLAFVERMTRFADRRAASASDTIRKLGLSPESMLASLNDRSAQGGPLISLGTSADGKLDPRFQRLGLSLARMGLLERGVAGIPRYLPASLQYISSGFGYRSDPFTGEGAMHAGLDFKGPIGAPIYAAAKGMVSFAGVKAGYGNCIEIDHGNGLMTRYAHMSAFRARVGEKVGPGSVVGAIGSSGRSTGPHLHFEVRINDRPVNPRPFLEAGTHVFEKASITAGSNTAQSGG